jgi:hypothetical protein
MTGANAATDVVNVPATGKRLVQNVRKNADRVGLARRVIASLKTIKDKPLTTDEMNEVKSLLNSGNKQNTKIGVLVARKNADGKVVIAASKWKKTTDKYIPGHGLYIAVDRLDKGHSRPVAKTLLPYIEAFKIRAARYFHVGIRDILVLGLETYKA